MERLLVTQTEMSYKFYSFDNQIIIFVALRDICLQQNSAYSLIYLSDLSLHINCFYFLPYFNFFLHNSNGITMCVRVFVPMILTADKKEVLFLCSSPFPHIQLLKMQLKKTFVALNSVSVWLLLFFKKSNIWFFSSFFFFFNCCAVTNSQLLSNASHLHISKTLYKGDWRHHS